MEQYQNPDAKPGFIPNSTKEYSNNNYFVREQRWQAPQNGTKLEYRVYQQQIDPNAKPLIKNGDMRTNLQLMQAGRAPYVLKNGKYEQLQLHHAQQDGRGALFELSAQTHLHLTNQTGRKAVHPYWPEAHPKFPVPEDRSIFGNDQTAYWIDRAKQYPGENNEHERTSCNAYEQSAFSDIEK
ncbi:HNH/ENDO VII family nuclease [Cardiobacterium hominis]|uniref:HNH/ENDO VII family nuclease n=1 Tax=Cardiobacterium hominis TaxID=2718 RepID=UPI0028F3F143|nr:HNH/ENDO VII family nuclease [Cardiobacterium hominis]